MDIKNVEQIMNQAMKSHDDVKANGQYQNAISTYLAENNSSEEIIAIVLNGFELDQGANYYDYLEVAPREELMKAWRQIKKSKEIKMNYNNNGLRFLSELFSLALMNKSILSSQQDIIMEIIMSMIGLEKRKIDSAIYEPIIREHFIDNFPPKYNFPEWEIVNAGGVCQKEFTQILLRIIEREDALQLHNIYSWARVGLRNSELKIEKEEIEKQIPKSKIGDLQVIVEHYKAVEKQLRESVHELARKGKQVKRLQEDIDKLQEDKKLLTVEIETLKGKLNKHEEALKKAEQKIEEHKTINDSFSAAKKQEEEALLNSIAEEINAEYKDFIESQNDEMDLVLGEIYREKLSNIFKLLERKGIRLE